MAPPHCRTYEPSPDGSAPRVRPVGRRIGLVHVLRSRARERQERPPDVVRWVKFCSLSWTEDGKGFFYGRYPEPPPGKALEAARQRQEDLLSRARHRSRPPIA